MNTGHILELWSPGQLFAFSGLEGETDFEHALVFRSGTDCVLELKLPEESGRLFFDAAPDAECFLASDGFRIGETNGFFPDSNHLLLDGPVRVSGFPDSIAVLQQAGKVLIGAADGFRPELLRLSVADGVKHSLRFFERLPFPDGLPERSRQAYAKACSQLKSQIYSPRPPCRGHWSTPDRWPHRRMWLWDSVFHAIGMRHLNLKIARELIASVLSFQREDGLIPHMMAPDFCSEITQPPILALGVRLLEDTGGDPAFLAESYPGIARHLEWIMRHRDADGNGLVEWAIEGNPLCRSGESGMDNSPRFDAARQLDAVDFNSYLSLECELMAGFATDLGKPDDARHWQSLHERLNSRIDALLWNEEAGIYMDRDIETGRLTGIAASSGFLPLICRAPSSERVDRLVAQLNDPDGFATPVRVPSISRKNAAHYRKDMWRGPVWINLNWLIAFGLERCGRPEEAERLRAETVALVEDFHERYGTFFEFYDDRAELDPPELLRKGKCDPTQPYHQVFHDYGWSATLYIDLLLRRGKKK